MSEEQKAMPWTAIWKEYCDRSEVPAIIKV